MTSRWDALKLSDPRHGSLTIGRTLLAVAQLTMLLDTPGRILFLAAPGTSGGSATGVGVLALWDLTGSSGMGRAAGLALACLVLCAVAVGFRPRWTCIPHWYITFSIVADVTVIDGGDQVAEVVTLLLIPLCLGDRRVWAWRPGPAPTLGWRGAGDAAMLALRLQVAFVYGEAVVSKCLYPVWRDGDAMRVLAADPQFGFPDWIRGSAVSVLSEHLATATLTWSVLLIETVIAVGVVWGVRTRRLGRGLAVCLHAGIIVMMGLFSFGLIMIALAWIVCAEGVPQDPDSSTSGEMHDHVDAIRPGCRVGLRTP
ncbi:MAG TPA: hypothetical protein VL551_33770 [Actinospica sp.]|jgi:antimicrobial peptide system SdpB family protein|nr:hypothetical protein [Actinospica sp.]